MSSIEFQSMKLLKTLFLCLFIVPLHAQTYIAGESYFGINEYTEYIHGNLPIIISAPHGGDLKPNEIADRDCLNCIIINDSFTQELSRELATAIFEISGCHPHVIINRLHRVKLDVNREIIEGANGDLLAEEAWHSYHDFIDQAQNFVSNNSGSGLFLDIHGHGHEIQRLELGYLLSKSDLQNDNLNNNFFINKSSIKSLAQNNLSSSNLEDLIRGPYGLGNIIYESGFDAVPSIEDPYPNTSDDYFSGGYNTQQYGSRDQGRIDAIQIECNRDVRFDETTRKMFADSLAIDLIEYMETHYPNFTLCNVTAVNTISIDDFNIYPLPFHESLHINSLKNFNKINIYDIFGQLITSYQFLGSNLIIDTAMYPKGNYILELSNHSSIKIKKMIIKI